MHPKDLFLEIPIEQKKNHETKTYQTSLSKNEKKKQPPNQKEPHLPTSFLLAWGHVLPSKTRRQDRGRHRLSGTRGTLKGANQ